MKVIKFSASWCQPCKSLSKMLEKDPLGVEVEEIDIDENSDMATQFKIRSVPTLVLMKDGVEVDRIMGTQQPAAIRKQFGLVA
jgi:thioredoxin 1